MNVTLNDLESLDREKNKEVYQMISRSVDIGVSMVVSKGGRKFAAIY